MSGKKKVLAVTAGFFVLLASAVIFLPLPGTIPVLVYTMIGTKEDAARSKNYVSRRTFETQMAFLHYLGYRVISLEEYEAIKTGKQKARGREVLITFDDGHYTFQTIALPVLKEYRFPAAIFLVSESVKRGLNDSMSAKTVKELLRMGFVTIGAHSKTHPTLPHMTEEQIREELAGSKKDLEEILGIPVKYLAYPNGDVDARVIKIAEEAGYQLAFTTTYKKLRHIPEGRFSFTRVRISRTSDNPFVFWGEVSGIYQGFKGWWEKVKLLTGAL
jgi:peptidoglycan/xylan/chitin deacetylase (PgdA/CDA1 family)